MSLIRPKIAQARRITVRLRIMAKIDAKCSAPRAHAETVDIHSSFSLVAILGRSVALFGIYWPSSGEGRLEGVGRSPAFPSFIVFSTRWKESRLNGV